MSEVMRQGGHTTMAVASRYQVTGEQHLGDVMARMNAYDNGNDAPASATDTTTAITEPATPSRDDTGDDTGELRALADVLAGMETVERVAVLRPLPVTRRVKVLELLPSHVRVETMTGLLGEVMA